MDARTAKWLRLGTLVVLIVGLLVLGYTTGLGSRLSSATAIRELVSSAGAWGALLFLAVFALGQLVQIPGMVFFAAAVIAYGRFYGFGLSYVGAVLSVSLSFAFARFVGGQPLAEVKNRRVASLLAKLDERPLTTVFVLRTLFWSAPLISYALALSKIRFGKYVLASAAGLILPIAAVSALFGIWFH